jgi:Tfp pilus assembly protein PilV
MTLLEVIIAGVIVAVGLVGLAAVMAQTMRNDRFTAARTKADNFAAEEIEIITAKANLSFDAVKTEYHDATRTFLDDVAGYSGRVESTESPDYLDLTVIVDWTENGIAEQVRKTKRVYDRSGYTE